MKYQSRRKALVILEDGAIFYGKAIGREGTAMGEICFNTGMTGYQEIFTDPSYYGQILITTHTHIGNYGIRDQEMESNTIKIAGLVCKNFSYTYSRPSAGNSLQHFLEKNQLFAISDVDTRALVSHIRNHGAMNALISTETETVEELKSRLSRFPSMKGLELASKVSTQTPYCIGNEQATYRIAVLDLGVKKSILENVLRRDTFIKVFPHHTPFEEMHAWQPDGFFISNGPGDPQTLEKPIRTVQEILKRNLPLFGICLGHQIIALANGISTYKMHHGHRGINHPVKNLLSGKGEITSQNHGFAIERAEAEKHPDIEITHVHLNDNTIAGIRLKNKNCFSVQYHPEASPGPHDASYLFDQFIQTIQQYKITIV